MKRIEQLVGPVTLLISLLLIFGLSLQVNALRAQVNAQQTLLGQIVSTQETIAATETKFATAFDLTNGSIASLSRAVDSHTQAINSTTRTLGVLVHAKAGR